MSKAISDVFDVDPVIPSIASSVPAISPSSDIVTTDSTSVMDSDSDLARKNLRELMVTANDALKESLILAVNSEQSKAFSVVAELLTVAAELNTKLLDTHSVQYKIKQALNKDIPVNATQNNTTNNVIFSGTPAELARLLRNPATS